MNTDKNLVYPQPSNPREQELLLLQQVFDAVALLDKQGYITWVSKGFVALLGFEESEVIGQPAWHILRNSASNDGHQTYLQQQLAARTPFRFEVLAPRKDGAASWVQVKVQPLSIDPNGEEPFACLLEDISARKATQRSLAESEERFRFLVEQVPGVLFQWREDKDGFAGFSYVSPKLYEIFGITPEQISHLSDIVHPADKPQWDAAMELARQEGNSWSFEGRLVVPGQPLRWCRANSLHSVTDEQGSMFSGILLDVTALKQAEEAVRESEQRWQLAMERFGDGAWEFNYQTGEEYFSKAYIRMLGYSEEEFESQQQTWLNHVHPEDQALSMQASDAYLRGEVPMYSVERRLMCKSGEYKWVLTRGLVTKYDEQGRPLIMTGVHTDISEIKKANLAIEATTLRLYTTISNFQEGILLEDENNRVVLANEAICRMFDVHATPEGLIGLDTSLFGQQAKNRFKDEEGFVQRHEELIRNRHLVTGDIFKLKDGRTLQSDFVPIQVNEKYIGNLWKFEDITERKNNEDALKRREEKYRGIIESMNLGLVEIDLNNQVTYVNQAFCDITGFRREEFLHQEAINQILHPNDVPLLAAKNSSRMQGASDTYELAIISKNGEQKWLLISGAPIYNDQKQIYGIISITLDITHQKQLEHNLRAAKEFAEESTRSKELFLANMSHEIRTPLNAILGMGQLLAKTPLNEEQQNYLRAIASSGENLLVIINDILDLSKIGASQLSIENIGFTMDHLLRQIQKSLHFKAEEKGLLFLTSVDARIPEVLLGDPYRLTQVLLNLAGNAIKFTEKGQVTITCELVAQQAGQVEIQFTVSDTGIGIDPEYLADIFKEFSQEDSSVTRKFGGTGLGLSISRGLVNLMGGELAIESQKYHGTRSYFSLVLPVGTEKDMPEKVEATPESREILRGKHILLVEDNVFNRQIAKGFLSNADMQITEAENGAIAVELARQQAFDVILMDVQMPVMNGLEATAFLREQLGLTTPVIALTANAIKGEREKCLQAGMNDYLSKPFQEEELLKIIGAWLTGAELPVSQADGERALLPPEPAFYNLEIIQKIGQGDAGFVLLMLESFIESAQEAIDELRTARQQQDVQLLRASAHKLKPSLEHVQVHRILPLVMQLDKWAGDFAPEVLNPLIENTIGLLQELISQMTQELQTLQSEA
ncbi:PAS domain S-box protein [Hymenobacter sp. BT730]|uniref:PAS domain S-box protein n=1 Tax=Hymenobacter sp. BT730 TaxID=3063332 RepID=UPI0026E038CF|nr:PAS domain S-box protein [Hymenobacter sp. BT730]